MKIRKRYLLLLSILLITISIGYGLNYFIKKNNLNTLCSQPLCKDLLQGTYWWLRSNLDPRKVNYDRLFQKKPDTLNITVSKKDIDNYNKQIKLGLNEGFLRDEWKEWRKVDLEIGSEKFNNIKMKLHGTSVTPIERAFSLSEKIKKAIGINTNNDFKGLSELQASFKLKLNKNKFFKGVRRITLISLMDDWNVTSVALTKIAKKLGLIVSVPTFKQVFINGSDAGIFLVMEEIDKELLERNYGITNYGILKSNDVWDKPFGQPHVSMTDDTSFDKEQSGTKPARDYALSKFIILMKAVKRNDVDKVRQLIDLDEFAKFSAIEKFYGTNHSSAGDNLRYLYNFSTGKFRLILRVEGGVLVRKNIKDISIIDHHLMDYYQSNIILKLLYKDKEFLKKRRQYLNYIISESSYLESIIKASIEELEEWSKRSSADITQKIKESDLSINHLYTNISFIKKYLLSHKIYISHLLGKSAIEILNESTFNVMVTSVRDCNNNIFVLDKPKIIPPNFYKKDWLIPKKISIPVGIDCLRNVFFESKFGSILKTNVFINSRRDFLDYETSYANFNDIFKKNVYFEGKNWFVNKGNYTINKTIILPYGTNLTLNPGVKINLAPNIGFLVRGDFKAVGMKDGIEISSKFRNNPFSTFAVLGNKSKPSKVKLHNFKLSDGNEGVINGIYFSGQMSIHNAEVVITASQFSNSNSDDGLNIKYANVKIKNNTFSENKGDALDCDFCKGIFSKNLFKGLSLEHNKGGKTDGLDLSGSKILVENNKFSGFSDKAISIGEISNVEVYGNIIQSSNIGVAVKDSSVAYLKDNNFKFNLKDISKYIKKRMYSAPKIFYK